MPLSWGRRKRHDSTGAPANKTGRARRPVDRNAQPAWPKKEMAAYRGARLYQPRLISPRAEAAPLLHSSSYYSCSLLHGECARGRGRPLGQSQLEHPVFVLGLSLFLVHVLSQSKGAVDPAVMALGTQRLLRLLLF